MTSLPLVTDVFGAGVVLGLVLAGGGAVGAVLLALRHFRRSDRKAD